ncbi:hypothetical protein, partial [Shouchella clausii]|uniref:hypothetical protein n=1 Tax=Shouchella clausii TaxID=79880 RepID=UPI001C3F11BF
PKEISPFSAFGVNHFMPSFNTSICSSLFPSFFYNRKGKIADFRHIPFSKDDLANRNREVKGWL